MQLLTGGERQRDKVLPQLTGLAGWTATLCKGVFNRLLDGNTDVLGQVDFGDLSEAARERSVRALLRASEKGTLAHDWLYSPETKGLNHPGLAGQLRPYVVGERSRGLDARRLALQLAERCNLQALVQDILGVALSQNELTHLRENAAYTTCRIGDDNAKKQLVPLLSEDDETDPDAELRGCALRALWPDAVSVDDVTNVLAGLQTLDLIGSMSVFLRHEFVQELRPKDFPAALRWAATIPLYGDVSLEFTDAASEVFLAAWKHLDRDDVLRAWTSAVEARVNHSHDLLTGHRHKDLQQKLITEPKRRRRVLRAMVSQQSELVESPLRLSWSGLPLVQADDIPWLIDHVRGASSEDEKRTWARLVSGIVHPDVPRDLLDQAIVACADEPILEEACARHFRAVGLDSQQAEEARGYWKETTEVQRQREEPEEEPITSPEELLAESLGRAESGGTDGWLGVLQALGGRERGDPWHGENDWQPADWPGWATVGDPARERINEAGLLFLRGYNPTPLHEINMSQWRAGELAGYCAFRLLLHQKRDSLEHLPDDVWVKWLPVLLRWGFFRGPEDRERHATLMKLAYSAAGPSLLASLPVVIAKENEQDLRSANYLQNIGAVWDDVIEACLLKEVYAPELSGTLLLQLLTSLLQHGCEEAKDFAGDLVRVTGDEHERERACAAARALFAWADDAGWNVVRPYLKADPERAKGVLLPDVYAPEEQAGDLVRRLGAKASADLFLRLCEVCPYTDRRRRRGRAIGETSDSRLSRLRDALLRTLVNTRSEQAVMQLKRVAEQRPDLAWMERQIQQAQARARAGAWTPLEPHNVISLPASAKRAAARKGAIGAFLAVLVSVGVFHLAFPAMAKATLALISEAMMLLGLPTALYFAWPKSSGR